MLKRLRSLLACLITTFVSYPAAPCGVYRHHLPGSSAGLSLHAPAAYRRSERPCCRSGLLDAQGPCAAGQFPGLAPWFAHADLDVQKGAASVGRLVGHSGFRAGVVMSSVRILLKLPLRGCNRGVSGGCAAPCEGPA